MVDEDGSDAELARRVAAGHAGAERELARRFAPRIRLYGLRHLGGEEQARDLVQEVLIAVLEALRAGRVEDPALVDRFMLGTCRNVASAWRRGEARRWRAVADLALVTDVAPPDPPARPDVARLLGCMAGLPPRDRSVLLLSFCEERPAEDIGRLLGLSPGNVRVVRHRALARVKDCVEGRS
jgi:RNA polymerase sigma-70 factor (ECF subfamily)